MAAPARTIADDQAERSPDAAARRAGRSVVNINPRTGLATDYLNHFNEAVMLLDMIADLPDCTQDFLDWQPMSYADHFAASNFLGRDDAVAAYEEADPAIRAEFDAVTGAMTRILTAVAAAMRDVRHDRSRAALAKRAVAWVKPLVIQAGSVINGSGMATAGRASDLDHLMTR